MALELPRGSKTLCAGFLAGTAFGKRAKAKVCGTCKGARSDTGVEDGKDVLPRFWNRTPGAKEAALARLQDFAAAKRGRCLSDKYVNNRVKLRWQCAHGHTWHATPHSLLHNNSWCPVCAVNRRSISLSRLQAHAAARGGQCLSIECRNSRARVRWRCKEGHVWEAPAKEALYQDQWCPACFRRKRKCMKRSLEDLQRHAASRGGQCLATEYTGVRSKVHWQCENGHMWRATASNVLYCNTWCPICAGRAPVGLTRLQEHAAKLGGRCLATEYVNNKSKVEWRCKLGHIWWSTADVVVNQGKWCPHCRKVGLPRLRAHAASLGGKCLAKSYKNNRTRVLWECREGHRWKATALSVLNHNSWCPKCAASTWRTEAEIRNILETIFHPAEFVSQNPSFLNGLQLDGYCKELSLAFEYQGEQHYDADNYFHFGERSSFLAQQERDARKAKLCEAEGVRLVLVPYFANDKRTFVVTALLRWFSICEISPAFLAAYSTSGEKGSVKLAQHSKRNLPTPKRLLFRRLPWKKPMSCCVRLGSTLLLGLG